MILEAKFGQHLPLNRQSQTYVREGIGIDVSTMAGCVGACTATLTPLSALIQAHVMAAARNLSTTLRRPKSWIRLGCCPVSWVG